MGLLDIFRFKKTPGGPSLSTIMIKLMIGDDQPLFILLSNDSTINRMGNGSENHIERAMFIGQMSLDVFNSVLKHTPPVVDHWIGDYGDPNPAGKICKLRIGFQTIEGKELFSQWQYGTESQQPPSEVTKLLIAAIEATNPWYESQKAMVAKAKKAQSD